MRIRVKSIVLALAVICLATAAAEAQQKTDSNDTSLGDVARQLKAQKAKAGKPAMVITNDNIPAVKPGEELNSTKAKSPADSTPDAEGSAKHDESYFRSRLSSLQNKLETDKRELEVMQQKLDQNQMQYYPDPNKSLMQQYTRDDINKRRAEVDAKQQQIADDQKAIDDLHEQLRHEGGDPSWLR